jgi:hypothetical protein
MAVYFAITKPCSGNLAAPSAQSPAHPTQHHLHHQAALPPALQTHRTHREEQARLLEENASLKARIAAEAARVAMGVLPGTGVGRPGPKTFAAVGEHEGMGGVLEAWMGKLERWVWLLGVLGGGVVRQRQESQDGAAEGWHLQGHCYHRLWS